MKKNKVKKVEKAWGSELWIVNCDKYCEKLLYLREHEECFCHHHPIKQETFYCLQGQVDLKVEDNHYQINPYADPITIEPGEKHSFFGITDAVILEVSTHHNDKDVVRVTESRLLV